MATMSLQVVAGFAITSFAGVLMLRYGVASRALKWRETRCHACGGIIGRTCTCDRG